MKKTTKTRMTLRVDTIRLLAAPQLLDVNAGAIAAVSDNPDNGCDTSPAVRKIVS